MSTTRTRPALAAGVLGLALALSACSSDESSAPAPVEALPTPLQEQVVTDVGQYLVTPRSDLTEQQRTDAVADLKAMAGVQSVTVTDDGKIDLVFQGNSTPEQREAAVKQLQALGTVEQGI